jgi:hypothetical protein
MENIKQYRLAVANLAENDVNAVFPNDGNNHALVVFEQIFKTAKNSICIAADSLCGEFTDNQQYIDSIIAFLKKTGSELKLLINNPENISSSIFFRSIKDFENVSLRTTSETFNTSEYSLVHFCVGDGKMYRLEYDTENRKAICNFNDKNRATTLLRAFESLFDRSEVRNISEIVFA